MPNQLSQLPTETNTDRTPTVSVIVPIFNEDESIEQLYDELCIALSGQNPSSELVFVNDGSTDRTAEILNNLADADQSVVVVHLKRNYGQTAALMAGIDTSTGDVLVPIDADLQNDPADIPKLVAKLDDGYDVVSGWRRQRQDKTVRRVIPSRCANWMISKISGIPLHDYGCSLKAYRREVMKDVRLYGEMHRLVPLVVGANGERIAEVEVNHRPRRFGKSNYGLNRVYKVILDLLLARFLKSFSTRPIHFFGGFGLICMGLSFVSFAASVVFKFMPVASGLQKDFVATPLPVLTAVLVLVGWLAVLQGITAELLVRTYYESQDKPIYSIRSVRGSDRGSRKGLLK